LTELLERVSSEQAPFVDGNRATFVYRGDQPPVVVGDFNNWGGWDGEPLAFEPAGSDTWLASLTLPVDAYVEYLFRQGDGISLDPFNSRTMPNGLGGRHNYFHMPAWEDTWLTRNVARVPHGKVTRYELYSDHLIVGGKRTVHLYHPPSDEACPLLIVFDGDDYLRRARLPQILDNLIHERQIRPLAAAFVNHARQARFVEYLCSDAHLAFLVSHVLPLAAEHLNLVDVDAEPGIHGVCGASMGGLMALYGGVRLPEVFGRVLSQSGAFLPDLPAKPALIRELIGRDVGRPVSVYLDVGRFEPLLDSNREMHRLLRDKGYPVTYRELNAGHNYTSWRNDLGAGLVALYGQPEHP
jgi:enterochelin esterase family protein